MRRKKVGSPTLDEAVKLAADLREEGRPEQAERALAALQHAYLRGCAAGARVARQIDETPWTAEMTAKRGMVRVHKPAPGPAPSQAGTVQTRPSLDFESLDDVVTPGLKVPIA